MENYRETSIPNVLTAIAWIIFIGGIIAGFVLGKRYYELYLPYALGYWFASFVMGMIFLAIAEIISQLQDIARRINNQQSPIDVIIEHKR